MSHQIHFGDINIYSLSTRKFAKFHGHLTRLGVEVVSLQETFHHRRSAVFSKIGQHYSYVEKERPSATRGYKRGGDDYGEERGWNHTHENGREI